MALPAGCRKVCRPKRALNRRVTAKAVGRFACYAREAGESSADIIEEISKCVAMEDVGCDKVREKIELAVAALAILAAIAISRGRANKLAAEETAALIERLRASSSTAPVGTIRTLDKVQALLIIGSDSDEKMNEAFAELLDNLKQAAQDARGEPPDGVVITDTGA